MILALKVLSLAIYFAALASTLVFDQQRGQLSFIFNAMVTKRIVNVLSISTVGGLMGLVVPLLDELLPMVSE